MHTSFKNRAYFFYETIVCAVPGAPLTNFIWMEGEGWGATEVHILYPQKSLLFLAHPKKSLGPLFATHKNSSVFVFLATQKSPGIFHRPKIWPKFQAQKNHLDPPPPSSLKYVSGASGVQCCQKCFKHSMYMRFLVCAQCILNILALMLTFKERSNGLTLYILGSLCGLVV